jgi:hypothetical protein
LFSLNVPVNAWINALRKTFKIVVITVASELSKLPVNGAFGAEAIFWLITEQPGQPTDDSLQDKIDWLVGIVNWIEDRHVLDTGST